MCRPNQRNFSPGRAANALEKYSNASISNYKDSSRRSLGTSLLSRDKNSMPSGIKPDQVGAAAAASQSNRSRRFGTASRNDDSIFEVLVDENVSSTPYVHKKMAQKRPPQEPITEITLEDDDEDEELDRRAVVNKANEARAQAETVSKLNGYQAVNRSSRPLTQLEKKIEETLNMSKKLIESRLDIGNLYLKSLEKFLKNIFLD